LPSNDGVRRASRLLAAQNAAIRNAVCPQTLCSVFRMDQLQALAEAQKGRPGALARLGFCVGFPGLCGGFLAPGVGQAVGRPLCWRMPERRLNLCPRAGVEGRNAIVLALLPLHPAACAKGIERCANASALKRPCGGVRAWSALDHRAAGCRSNRRSNGRPERGNRRNGRRVREVGPKNPLARVRVPDHGARRLGV
jgi:hypothetical protein